MCVKNDNSRVEVFYRVLEEPRLCGEVARSAEVVQHGLTIIAVSGQYVTGDSRVIDGLHRRAVFGFQSVMGDITGVYKEVGIPGLVFDRYQTSFQIVCAGGVLFAQVSVCYLDDVQCHDIFVLVLRDNLVTMMVTVVMISQPLQTLLPLKRLAVNQANVSLFFRQVIESYFAGK